MPVTNKLYNKDHYMKSFTAKVLSINENEVILNRTAFYPRSGGQKGDTGTINGYNVVDTKIQDEQVIHILDSIPDFKTGDIVEGVIDWDRRYKTMKLHTASHIMEYFLWKHFGHLKRTGSNVDDKKDRADYIHDGRLDPDKLRQTEIDTNKFLNEYNEVSITVDDKGMRNWKCGPIEMHCAGTHVKNTQEIGAIKLKRKNPGKGEERIETRLVI